MNNPIIISFGDPGSINSEILLKSIPLIKENKNDLIIIGSRKALIKESEKIYYENNLLKLFNIEKIKTIESIGSFEKIIKIKKEKLEIYIKKSAKEIYYLYLSYKNNKNEINNNNDKNNKNYKNSENNENSKNINDFFQSDKKNIFFFDPFEDLNFEIARIDIKNGFLSYLYLAISCALIEILNFNAYLITMPLNKKSVSLYDREFKGHTDFLIERYNAKDARMLMHSDKLSILMETNHLPILKLKKYLNSKHFLMTLFSAKDTIEKLKLEPYIYVLGLNPHKSDDSLIGNDEEKWIIPKIEKFKKILNNKIFIEGPFSSDSVFTEKSLKNKKHGIFIAWYHDQGLIPFKILAANLGANITIGLPFLRISPDHGTGFDIVGKNMVDISSFMFCLKVISSLEER
ncbi:MAG TPA: 4-hydroxythreonine-4-phosphate dehydrogenase PdxA [Exilispira sp.]|nr:4-hydroxythreonine-4-phosphate dehydrogenase PdxA [Exilispira sp.]